MVQSTGSVKRQKESERKNIADRYPTIVQQLSTQLPPQDAAIDAKVECLRSIRGPKFRITKMSILNM